MLLFVHIQWCNSPPLPSLYPYERAPNPYNFARKQADQEARKQADQEARMQADQAARKQADQEASLAPAFSLSFPMIILGKEAIKNHLG